MQRRLAGLLATQSGEHRPASLPGSEMAAFYVALGEKDKVFAELDECYEEFGRLLQISPRLNPLRDDSRFAETRARQ